MKITKAAAVSALLPLLASVASSQEWTRFRGPNGSGVSSSTGLPTEFGPEKNVAWKAELPFATSSPVLTKDTVYVTASTEAKLLVLCLERSDGSTRWTRELDRAQVTEVYPANDSASPSPVTDGQNVYAFFPELGLVSYDAKGEQRWVLPLEPFVSFYGMSASPILAGDALILQCDQQQGSYLLAVDKNTGKELWKTERTGMIESWATPVLYPTDAPTTAVVFGTYLVCGYSLATGAETWRMKGLGYTPVCSPIVEGDRVFACVPNHAEQPLPKFDSLIDGMDANEDGMLSAEELGESPLGEHFGWADADKDELITVDEWAFVRAGMSNSDYGLVAIDLEKGAEGIAPVEAWRYKRALPSISTPLLYDGIIYLTKDGGIVTTLDAGTGEVAKSERVQHGGSEFYPSPVAADGRVYVASNAGDVTVLKAGGEWEILAVNSLGEEIQACPAIADGALYIRTRTALYCFREAAER
jgi:outer membrane protein assembly factor BamB